MSHNRLLPLVLALVLAVATACGGSEDDNKESSSGSDSSSESGESVDVPDVPDVVAEVNGEEISSDDFADAYESQSEAIEQQLAQGGQQPDEKQLVDQIVQSLVNEELLKQEADSREIEPTDEQVEQTLTEAAQQNGVGSAEEFVKALEDQGLSTEEVEEQAAQQATFDMLVAEESGPVEATEKELRAYYQQLKTQQQAAAQSGQGQAQQELPPFKQVRPQLVQQVESQKTQQVARGLIDQLREDADITINT